MPDDIAAQIATDKARAAEAMAALAAAIAKTSVLLGTSPHHQQHIDRAELTTADKAIQKLARQIGASNAMLKRRDAEREAQKLRALDALRSEVAKAQAMPARIQAYIDSTDLDTIREAMRTIDQPTNRRAAAVRRDNDRLDQMVRDRMHDTGASYTVALDQILAERKT